VVRESRGKQMYEELTDATNRLLSELDTIEKKLRANIQLDNLKRDADQNVQKVLLTTDWSKWNEKNLSTDKMCNKFCFAEWKQIKDQLYDIVDSCYVVDLFMAYVQKWTLRYNYNAKNLLGNYYVELAGLSPSQEIGCDEIWKFAFKKNSSEDNETVIGFILSEGHGRRFGLGCDGSIQDTIIGRREMFSDKIKIGNKNSKTKLVWRCEDVVVMVLDTIDHKVTFQVGRQVVAKKLDLKQNHYPIRVGVLMANPRYRDDDNLNVEVLDGLCVSKGRSDSS